MEETFKNNFTGKNPLYYEHESFGPPKWSISYLDIYRYKVISRYIFGKSVIDVGCGNAVFLKLLQHKYNISGIEVNKKRVTYCNNILGKDIVIQGNLEYGLPLEDNSYDTVVAMEILEHMDNPSQALRELTRISRKRVIFTVPYDEKIQYTLCIHCVKWTPQTAHLHSFNWHNLSQLIPENVKINTSYLLCNKLLTHLAPVRNIYKLPVNIAGFIDRSINHLYDRAKWMLVVIDKN
jgi:methionine biosynthesis protein MetW